MSAVAFGTMRLLERVPDVGRAADLLGALQDSGVTTLHVSQEYEAHGLACAAVGALRRNRPGVRIELISKIAAPHFDEAGFDPARFEARIDADLKALGAGRIDVVQWLVRATPNEDTPRLAALTRGREAIERTAERLKAAGKIGALAVFPYSRAFALEALMLGQVDGLADYLGPLEPQAGELLDRLHAEGRGFVGIRPLGAGRIREPGAVAEAVRFALSHPAAATTIVSLSNAGQARAVVTAASRRLSPTRAPERPLLDVHPS